MFAGSLEETLNTLGDQGWEVVSIAGLDGAFSSITGNKLYAVLKRERAARQAVVSANKGPAPITRSLEVTGDPRSPFMSLELDYRYPRVLIQRAWSVARQIWPETGDLDLLRRLIGRADKGEDLASAWAALNE